MNKSLIACSVALCSALIFCAGCTNGRQDDPEYYALSKTVYAMDTSATLVITDKFSDAEVNAKFMQLCTAVEDKLNEIENSISAHDEKTYIYAFNEAQAGDTVAIDKISYDLLNAAKSVYTLTDGCYNPAVYYSVYEYGFHGLFNFMTPEALPSAENIAKYASLATHFGEIELTEGADGTYYATKPAATVEVNGETLSLKIDLGGIGKGYAVDEVNKIIDSFDFTCGYFNFGQSSITVKAFYPDGEYNLGFSDPRSEIHGAPYLNTKVKNVCLSTSGDYEQYYELDGVRYCHIIDPYTGAPVQTGIMTATVIGGSAAEDDALTTAIMCMGKEKAIEFINGKLSDRLVVFTYDNGGSYEFYTNIPADSYTVVNSNYTAKELK